MTNKVTGRMRWEGKLEYQLMNRGLQLNKQRMNLKTETKARKAVLSNRKIILRMQGWPLINKPVPYVSLDFNLS